MKIFHTFVVTMAIVIIVVLAVITFFLSLKRHLDCFTYCLFLFFISTLTCLTVYSGLQKLKFDSLSYSLLQPDIRCPEQYTSGFIVDGRERFNFLRVRFTGRHQNSTQNGGHFCTAFPTFLINVDLLILRCQIF